MTKSSASNIQSSLSTGSAHSSAVTWGVAAVRLLQGVVYHDDNRELWECLLNNVSPLTDYFAKIGLQLVIDQSDAMAYLRQSDDDDHEADSSGLPRLFRRTQMTYEQTVLCVLLRDHLRMFEEEDVQDERCVILQSDLLAIFESFFPAQADQVRLNRILSTNLRRLEELKFVRQFEKEPPSWEIRRIVKARLPLSELEALQQSLLAHLQAMSSETALQNSDGHLSESGVI